ncbi:cytochrome c oxidase subunit II [Chitinophaga vietnamensis]|uniref:cytochrome c oxidase subunit II n=1 Tax=Chitinophaga vietnamensis TaxID=2593957 RepID=UPI001F45DB20|nr:cytochrome c oxidase subunit II [Chitinophaga vietnamensis]
MSILKGEKKARQQSNRINGFLLIAFLVLGLIAVYYCNDLLKGKILGDSASVEGEGVDTLIYVTLAITGVVFVITQVLLFYFAFKYQEKEGQKAFYFPHNNKLEVIWTVIPAIALTVLVAFGLKHWFRLTSEAPKDAAIVEITGKQFNWLIRYPGKDGQLGRRDFKLIDPAASNELGIDWNDPLSKDDYQATEVHLVVNKPVKFVIGSRDVIHDVGLPQFRMKMDAVPGIPTTLWFTPRFTTKQMKEKTGNPDFTYEISCDQMCGSGHYSMRGVIVVETQAEFDAWVAKQPTQYSLAHPAATPAAPAADSTQKTVAANIK